MAGWPVGQRVCAHDDLVAGHGAVAGEYVLQCAEPLLVVAPALTLGALTLGRVGLPGRDSGDQRGLELIPGERAGLLEGDGHAEDATLP